MARVFVVIGVLAAASLGGCRRSDEPGSGSQASQPPAVTTPAETVDAPAPAPTPPAEEPTSPPPAETPAAATNDRDTVCAQAARCCEAAFNTPGLPPMFAERREMACSSITGIPDAAGCRMALESWGGMVGSVPGAEAPTACHSN